VNRRIYHNSYSLQQAGFSLIELLVAMLLSLIVTAVVLQIFVSSNQAYRVREQVALLAENGRYATELLQRDLRMAGYSGCRTLAGLSPNVIANNPPAFSGFADGLQGFESGSGWTNPTAITQLAGTDVLVIRRATGLSVPLTGNMATLNANIQIASNPYGFAANDVLLVTDCEAADLIRASNVSQGSGVVTIAHAMSTNTDNRLSKAYQENAMVMGFSANTYFIGENAEGDSSLYMIPFESTTALELIPGAQDLQVQYAIDKGNNGVLDEYVDASAVSDWQEVIGVNIGTLLHTADNITVGSQPFTFNGANVNPSSDRRLRSSNWVAIALRNRLN